MADPIVHKDYCVGFRVTTEMLEDSDYFGLMKYLEEMKRSAAQSLADQIYTDLSGHHRKPVPKPNRLRRWLGLKLRDWAWSLDPDLMDY